MPTLQMLFHNIFQPDQKIRSKLGDRAIDNYCFGQKRLKNKQK
jgi:hypothetical protein